jgi:hypothetical protein
MHLLAHRLSTPMPLTLERSNQQQHVKGIVLERSKKLGPSSKALHGDRQARANGLGDRLETDHLQESQRAWCLPLYGVARREQGACQPSALL